MEISNAYICRKLILYQRLFSENWKGKSSDEGYISRRRPFKILFSVWQTPSFTFHIFAQLYLQILLSVPSLPLPLLLFFLFYHLSLTLSFLLSLLGNKGIFDLFLKIWIFFFDCINGLIISYVGDYTPRFGWNSYDVWLSSQKFLIALLSLLKESWIIW